MAAGGICNSSRCRDCFSTFWGEILQFDPREGSAAKLRDLLIVLVLLDLIPRNRGSVMGLFCKLITAQVDYCLSAMEKDTDAAYSTVSFTE